MKRYPRHNGMECQRTSAALMDSLRQANNCPYAGKPPIAMSSVLLSFFIFSLIPVIIVFLVFLVSLHLGVSSRAPIIQLISTASPHAYFWFMLTIVFLLYICFTLKRIIIWLVRVYQCFAPDQLRSACLFVPSCSEYMVLSLRKYNVVKALWKGIYRLYRCRAPNGGIDLP